MRYICLAAGSPEPVGPGSILHHYLRVRACELGVSSGAQVRAERARTVAAEHTGSSHRTQAILSRPACSMLKDRTLLQQCTPRPLAPACPPAARLSMSKLASFAAVFFHASSHFERGVLSTFYHHFYLLIL
eukprot:scaffold7202_cov110-Isochrysis_galbana.AAC.3